MEESKKILVVEDESDMRQMVAMRLEAAGYSVATAENGKDGLDKLAQECPDLIISDVLMPEMDGFAFYKELKKKKSTADIPVLILTARGQMEDSFKVIGVDDFISKPFESQNLLDKVENLLRHSKVATRKLKEQKKVLLAGTNQEVLNSMILLLRRAGCEIAFTLNGPDIITLSVKLVPDIFVMDIQMDGMPSPEIIQVLRRMPQSEKKPVLVYSYFKTEDLGSASVREKTLAIDVARGECMDSGATKYIDRFNEHTFVSSIEPYLHAKAPNEKKE